jgi:glycosyltransferase involved in cell wall biosynthesis
LHQKMLLRASVARVAMNQSDAKRLNSESLRFYKKGTNLTQESATDPNLRGILLMSDPAMRAAIVHYWLVNMRGGEKVLEALCRLMPEADIYTLYYDPERVSPFLRSRRIHASFLNPFRRYYRMFLPLAPMALEHFDLRGYDLVVSCEAGPAKGVLTASGTRHVCYCHTPMRYLWDLYPAYLREWSRSPLKRAAIAPLTHYLRLWDFASAARVDEFVANSVNVQRRISKTYRRESSVVYPPVDVQAFYSNAAEDYYLIVSELVTYKQIDYAVRWFSKSGRRLLVVGGGPESRKLRRIGRGSVEFCGRVSNEELREILSRCRALVMPGEEDFGMVPVEALASGKPVIALGRGGVLESVPPNGGTFYNVPSEDALGEAVGRFESIEGEFVAGDLQRQASKFSESVFEEKMSRILFSDQAAQSEWRYARNTESAVSSF